MHSKFHPNTIIPHFPGVNIEKNLNPQKILSKYYNNIIFIDLSLRLYNIYLIMVFICLELLKGIHNMVTILSCDKQFALLGCHM